MARDTRFLMLLGLACFASSLGGRATDPMVTTIAADFMAPVATVALLSTSYALPYGLCQPILGPLGDMLGKSAVLKLCVALMAVALAAGAVAASLDMLFASRIAAGIAAGGVIPLALAMLGDRFELAKRQVAIGRVMAATLIGQIAGVTSAGVLAETIGWRGAIWTTAAIGAIAAVGVFIGLPRDAADAKHGLSLSATFGRYRDIFRNTRAFVCYGGVLAEGFAIYGAPPYIAEMLEKSGMGGPSEAGFILSGIGIGGFVFSVLVARVLALLGPFGMMRAGGLFAGTGLAIFGLTTNWIQGTGCFFLIGMGFFMLHSSLQNRATELAPHARGSAVALHAFFFFFGQALAPVVFGAAYHHVGALPSLIACGLVMAATGLITAQLLMRMDQRDAAA